MIRRFATRHARSRAPAPRGAAIAPVIGLVAGALSLACSAPMEEAAVEEDHTHAGGAALTIFTDSLELFVEYPPHVRDVPSDPWAIHLTWLADWQPVRDGSLTLLLRGPGGASEEIVIPSPSRAGVFTATPRLPATGTWRADMTLAAHGGEFAIPVGQLQVFESEDALPHEDEEAPADLIPFLKEQQWSMPFAVGLAAEREVRSSLAVSGRLTAPPPAMADLSVPVAGLILARGPAPAPGQTVRSGETLALIAPTTIDGSYARLLADVREREREVARAERLLAAEAIAARRLEEARQELAVARSALEALGGIEPGADPQAGDVFVYRLRSPIGGVVSERHIAPGQWVDAGAPAFTIVNPSTLWLVAHVPARHAPRASDITGARFTPEGGTELYEADRIVSVGSVLDPDTRTLPVRAAVVNPDGRLKVGMLADVLLLVGEPEVGVAIPTEAIQNEDGLPVAYVKVGGEAFQRRVLRIGSSDGEWTIVRSGVAAGEHVVTAGAYQVKLASLGDAEISDHGHPH